MTRRLMDGLDRLCGSLRLRRSDALALWSKCTGEET